MKYLESCNYKNIDWVWISNHWDIHLEGLCRDSNGKLALFNCSEEIYPLVKIYKLTFIEKLKWIKRKLLFEVCIGRHFTYNNGKKAKGHFYYKRPVWLWKKIFNIYYRTHAERRRG